MKFLDGYKTYIGVAITLISTLLGLLGKDFGIDWAGVEAGVGTLVGALISLYGYIVTNRGADK